MTGPAESTRVFTQALKEWAVVVDALLEGRQILTIRKGGIAESEGVFRTDISEFLLFPTFEHQSPEAVRPEERGRFDRLSPPGEAEIVFPGWAVVREVVPVGDRAALERIASQTIWTAEYLDRRFRQMPRRPLFALGLEVHPISPPARLTPEASFAGCKSHVGLGDGVEVQVQAAVAEDFERRWADLREGLGPRRSNADEAD
jgi:hypothetical protein